MKYKADRVWCAGFRPDHWFKDQGQRLQAVEKCVQDDAGQQVTGTDPDGCQGHAQQRQQKYRRKAGVILRNMDESKQDFIGTDCGATMSKVGGVWADGTTIRHRVSVSARRGPE